MTVVEANAAVAQVRKWAGWFERVRFYGVAKVLYYAAACMDAHISANLTPKDVGFGGMPQTEEKTNVKRNRTKSVAKSPGKTKRSRP